MVGDGDGAVDTLTLTPGAAFFRTVIKVVVYELPGFVTLTVTVFCGASGDADGLTE